MNIFYLDEDPIVAAEYLCDKHIVKMCVETAQILSMVSWYYNIAAHYKNSKQYRNHPCVLWARYSLDNWEWLILHGLAIGEQYTLRYKKIHKSLAVIEQCYNYGGRSNKIGFTYPSLCMPEKYKQLNPVLAYRQYYIYEKSSFAKWRLGNIPFWWR